MLKEIQTNDVEVGMFVHRMCGSWFAHPFWKSRFLVANEDQLAKLLESDVPSVVIDTDRGLDLRQQPRALRPVEALAREVAPLPVVRPIPYPARGRTPDRPVAISGMAREFGQARAVATRSRKVVSQLFLESRFGKAIRMSSVEPVIEDIFASVQRNPLAFNGLMRCKRDNELLYRHSLAVSALMIALARQIKLTPAAIREAGVAGLLMDVGIGLLPVDMAEHGGDFRKITQETFRTHVQLGHDFLLAGGDIPPSVLDACLCHHERLDGSGYPRGLAGDQISTLSRIAAICDHFDTQVSDSSNQAGASPASVIEAMLAAPAAFDPAIMAAFVEVMGVYPIGTFVRLASGRIAMVVDQSSDDSARPAVRMFWSAQARRPIRRETLILSQAWGDDAIEAVVDPEDLGIGDPAMLRQALLAGAVEKA